VSVAVPARRAPARGRPAADAPPAVAVARRVRRVRTRRITAGGVAWVVVLAALFGGIVALNVAALRDSIDLNRMQAREQMLNDQNRLLQNRVTSLSSPVAIGKQAQKLGMRLADPNTTRYLGLHGRHRAGRAR
jgi:cell division protein FtsL